MTRRGLLSTLASVYDPLGMAGPFLLPESCFCKDYQNRVWIGTQFKLCFADADCRDWEKWLRVLPCLDGLSIPRVLSNFSTAQSLELHCFADGSAIGFGAVCYFKCFDGQNYSCSFVAGKSRVAPSPKQTVPRLELCAAVTAVRLAKTVKNEYDFKFDRVFFWLDSITVLSYINNTSKRRPAFETNRIDLIRRHSEASQWRWVDT